MYYRAMSKTAETSQVVVRMPEELRARCQAWANESFEGNLSQALRALIRAGLDRVRK